MPNFNAYGKLASLASETYARYEQEGESWDVFLKSAEGRFPNFFPTWEDVESEDFRVRKPCDNLDFLVYQNIIHGHEILGVRASNICDDLFRFLDAFKINEIRVGNVMYNLKKLSSLFEQAGWKLHSVSFVENGATFKRQ